MLDSHEGHHTQDTADTHSKARGRRGSLRLPEFNSVCLLSYQGHFGSTFQIPWKPSLVVHTVLLRVSVVNREIVRGWCAHGSQEGGPRVWIIRNNLLVPAKYCLNDYKGWLPSPAIFLQSYPPPCPAWQGTWWQASTVGG